MNHYHRPVCSIRPLTVGTPLLKKIGGLKEANVCNILIFWLQRVHSLAAHMHKMKVSEETNWFIIYCFSLSLFAKAATKCCKDLCYEKIYPRSLDVVDHIKRIKRIRVSKSISWSTPLTPRLPWHCTVSHSDGTNICTDVLKALHKILLTEFIFTLNRRSAMKITLQT